MFSPSCRHLSVLVLSEQDKRSRRRFSINCRFIVLCQIVAGNSWRWSGTAPVGCSIAPCRRASWTNWANPPAA